MSAVEEKPVEEKPVEEAAAEEEAAAAPAAPVEEAAEPEMMDVDGTADNAEADEPAVSSPVYRGMSLLQKSQWPRQVEVTGGRQRKEVHRFEVEEIKKSAPIEIHEVPTTRSPTLSHTYAWIQQGKGKRLADLPGEFAMRMSVSTPSHSNVLVGAAVKEMLDKYPGSSDEAKTLHKIIWGKPGQV